MDRNEAFQKTADALARAEEVATKATSGETVDVTNSVRLTQAWLDIADRWLHLGLQHAAAIAVRTPTPSARQVVS